MKNTFEVPARIEEFRIALYMVRFQPTKPVEPARIKPFLHAPTG